MKTTKTSKTNKLDFYVYIVQDGGEGKKSFWTKVGIAYRHNDGQGLNLQLIANPVDGKLTLREPSEPVETDDREEA